METTTSKLKSTIINEDIKNNVFNTDHINAIIDDLSILSNSIDNIIPKGIILMWQGSIATIPDGWVLCNGNNGAPNLTNKFIVGAENDDSGIAVTNLNNHRKGGQQQFIFNAGDDDNGEMVQIAQGNDNYAWVDIISGNILVPYYALAYIMKN